MKISFYELFDLMAEDALELLSEDMAESTVSPEDVEGTTDRDSTFFSAETTINGENDKPERKPSRPEKEKSKIQAVIGCCNDITYF